MSDTFLREEELQVLESIYPDYISDHSRDYIRLEIPIELGTRRNICLNTSSEATTSRSQAPSSSTKKLSHLPPLVLELKLPESYPSSAAPLIIALYSLYNWLACCPRLIRFLRDSWIEGEGVLCTWVELIRSGDFLEGLDLVHDSNTITLQCLNPSLPQILSEYDERMFSDKFSQTSFPCAICFDHVKGARCMRLSCSHVFCRPCLQAYWASGITSGSLEQVSCADPTCVKEKREVAEEDVARVVSEKELLRWKWLKTKKAIERDPTIMHCPIPTCQAAVVKSPQDANQSSAWERFRYCTACGFSFCSLCKHTWHGPISACPKSVILSLIKEYLEYSEHSPERRALERKFGANIIAKHVRDYEEEQSTQAWLANSTTECPGCHVYVEKSLGCNHMTCAKCQQHFCYRCGAKLNPLSPYEHFSSLGSSCHGKLFDMPENHTEDD